MSINRKIQYRSVAVCFILFAVIGFVMSRKPLWGWLPLPFLSLFWLLILLLRLKKYQIHRLLLSMLSGILLTLGFPNSPFTPLMFIGFVPLLLVEKDIFDSGNKDNFLKYAYNAFVIWNIGSTWWVSNAGLAAGMIANFLNAFFMSIPLWLFHNSRSILKGWHYTAFVIYWLAFEYVHLNWEITWSWLTLGNAFAQYPSWVQWYEYTGVFGGSLWILLMNILALGIWNKYKSSASSTLYSSSLVKNFGIFFLLFLIPLSISLLIHHPTTDSVAYKSDLTAKVVVVQPNYEPHYEKFVVPDNIQLQKYLRLSAEKVDSTTDYLVFPETSFDFRHVEGFNDFPIVQELKKYVNQYPRLHLITGIDALKVYASYVSEKPKGLESSVREHENGDGSFTYYEAYNAATQLSAGVDSLPLYKKSKLVPGAEILPYGFLFGWLKPLFRKFGGTTSGFGAQKERSAFVNKNGKIAIAPMICYESVFGDFSRGYVHAGANAFFVVTNDGWWDDTPGYKQHLKFACLRAIECRRAVVRSANTGSSSFINQWGYIEQATPYAVDAVISGSIQLNNNTTFYVKVGDIIGQIASYLGLSLLLIYILKITIKRLK